MIKKYSSYFFNLANEEEEKNDNKSNNDFYIKSIEKNFIDQRKIFLWGGVDDKSAREITNKLLYLDSLDNKKEITFYINSPGGIVSSGMVIYDVMRLIKSPVHTVCMGLAASMGSILLSAGKKGQRYVFPNGEIMIHQPSIGGGIYQGTSADLEIQAEQIRKTKEIGAKILADNTGKTMAQIMKDFDRDYWLNADEAIKYGIVDHIVEKL